MEISKARGKFALSALGLFTGFVNGLFGAGGGMLLVPAMQRFLKVEVHKAHATAISIILPMSMVSAFIYTRGSDIDWRMVLFVSIGGGVGSFVGAKLLNKIPKKRLTKLFALFVIAAAIRMII